MHHTSKENRQSTIQHTAQEWRERHGYIGRGGYVIIHEGSANGWTAALRENPGWVAGCMAIPEDGSPWYEAVGGNYMDGATHWEALTFAWETRTHLVAVFAQNLQSLALETHGLHLAPPRPPLADLLRQAATDAQPFTRHA